jgi:hypothetical protein
MITGEVQTWHHSRKGRITGVITSESGDWVTVKRVPDDPEAGFTIVVRRASLMPACPRCGEPMKAGTALLNVGGRCEPLDLPPSCDSLACRRGRDEEAIARAIAAGVINP